MRVTGAADSKRVDLPKLKERGHDPSTIVPLQNDLIPDELLATLTSTVSPLDRLGPPKLNKTPKDFKPHGIRRTDAVWHHPVGRKKYKYFLDQPTSVTGAGRDVSFLCDAIASQKERIPLPPMGEGGSPTHMQKGIHQEMSLMDSLIPEEYHIVKNKGVQGLECYDDKFTIFLEDEEKMLKVFPSLRPSGRLEAVQLMKVMDAMLDKAGVNQDLQELSGLSQMQGLLELVRIEQNIYNIVFHELIRQVSVSCVERGQLLAKVRQRYVSLLDRVPRYLKGLHTETLAQRALDRRLTEEIIRFKGSVTHLSMELSLMREHDELLSKHANGAQEELARALEQSQRDSDTVLEYHNLYEMQRARLETQVAQLTDERDRWSKVTYNLALKVIKIHNLQLANRLHVSEQTWTKTAEHFTVFLTSKDSEDLNRIKLLTDQWKEHLTGFMCNLREAEKNQCENIQAILAGFVKWHVFCDANIMSPDPKFEKASVEQIYTDLKQWLKILTLQCERYGGEELLSCQETLNLLGQRQEAWVAVGLQLFRRHPAPDGEPPKGQEAMKKLGKVVSELHKQLGTRVNGENGSHSQLMSLGSATELWATKLKAVIGRPEGLPHLDWLKLDNALSNWISLAEEVLQNVDSTQPENEKKHNTLHNKIEIGDVFNTMREFISDQTNFFDCEDRRLCEEVSSIHIALTRWMVDLLLQLVPDHCEDQEMVFLPGPQASTRMDVLLAKLEEDAKNLAHKLDSFSNYITSSCQTIVEEEIQKSIAQDDFENELYELNQLQVTSGPAFDSHQSSPVDLCVTLNAIPLSVTNILTSPSASGASLEILGATPNTSVEEVACHAASIEGEPEADVEVVEGDTASVSFIKLIGHDGSIIEKTLEGKTVPLNGTEEWIVCPTTENAQRAFDALACVGILQQDLLDVESRAQRAEERALKAEEALQAALVKIQDLERQLQGRHSLEPQASKKPVAPAAPKTVVTPEPKPVSQKAEPSPKPTKPKKR
ncbi:axonemal dynein light chain domain-containing protein 1 [Aplochiton taeniatus]